jgi:hypothetical protein
MNDVTREIQDVKMQIAESVNAVLAEILDQQFNRLLQTIESKNVQPESPIKNEIQTKNIAYESIYPLAINPGIFKGKKPTGVLFGENGRVDVGTWKTVCSEILHRCNADPEKHVALMNLRGKISGRERIFLAKETEGMRSPLKLSENLYVETHYDTETLLRIMTTRILDAVGYDYSGISVAIRNS